MTQDELINNYTDLTEVEKEIYFELIKQGCDRDYVLDLLKRVRQ